MFSLSTFNSNFLDISDTLLTSAPSVFLVETLSVHEWTSFDIQILKIQSNRHLKLLCCPILGVPVGLLYCF